MTARTTRAWPLGRLLTLRLALVTMLVFLLQSLWVVWMYQIDPEELREDAVERAIDQMLAAEIDGGDLAAIRARMEGFADTALAVADGDGLLLRSTGDLVPEPGLLSPTAREVFLSGDGLGPGSAWQGVRRVTVGDRSLLLWVRLDFRPGQYPWRVLVGETAEDMLYPLAPTILLLLLANVAAAGWSLRGIAGVARRADAIDAEQEGARLDAAGLPSEVATLVDAINGALGRLDEALRRQRAFNADAAHELRTPLAALMLELETVPGAQGERLRADVAGLSRRVEQVLGLSRLGTLRLGPADRADPAVIATHLVTRHAPRAIRAGRSLELEIDGALPILADAMAVEGALLNLIDNALNASPVGTTVTIIAGPGPCLSVMDQGPGIPPAMAARMFDRHWQADRRQGRGAGLGLAIVAQTMQAHGGHVSVECRPDGTEGAWVKLHFRPAPVSAGPGPNPG